jgi:hypothetical protein
MQAAFRDRLERLANTQASGQVRLLPAAKGMHQGDNPMAPQGVFPLTKGGSWSDGSKQWETILRDEGHWERFQLELALYNENPFIVLEAEWDSSTSSPKMEAFLGGADGVDKDLACEEHVKLLETKGFVSITVRNETVVLMAHYILLVSPLRRTPFVSCGSRGCACVLRGRVQGSGAREGSGEGCTTYLLQNSWSASFIIMSSPFPFPLLSTRSTELCRWHGEGW